MIFTFGESALCRFKQQWQSRTPCAPLANIAIGGDKHSPAPVTAADQLEEEVSGIWPGILMRPLLWWCRADAEIVHRLEHRADHRFVLDHPVGVRSELNQQKKGVFARTWLA
jgi:hypothetical protein